MNALTSQDFPTSDYEIIIANNDPADPTPDTLDLPANARILPASQPGSYAARNAALAESVGDLIAFTDSDCIPEHDWLSTAVQHMTDHQEVGVIAGAIHVFARSDRANPVEICDRIFFLRQDQYAANGYAFCIFCSVVIRENVLEPVRRVETSPFTDAQKAFIIKQGNDGPAVADIRRNVSSHIFQLKKLGSRKACIDKCRMHFVRHAKLWPSNGTFFPQMRRSHH